MAYRSIGSFYAAGDAASAFRRPALILLEQEAHFTDSRNETTAAAKSMGGYTMAVSFWMANPPDLSFFSVHCSKPPNSYESPNFKVLPHVVGAEGPFVLLCARFFRSSKEEYFMYNAIDSPSLEWVPPPPHPGSPSKVREFGIVTYCFGCQYRLAALRDAPSDYQLQIYCSETKTWSTMTLINPCPGVKIVPEKVVRLAEGSLGWVDLSCGLLTCDLRQEPPCASFIPLPVPLPENRGRLKKASEPGVSASVRWLRDLVCVNGVLKFIEMEYRFKEAEKTIDPSDNEILLDSDLIMSLRHKNMDEKDKSRDGWRAMIWTRADRSNCWSKRCTVDVNDIMVDESFYLVPETRRALEFRDMYPALPTLSPDGYELLYFKLMAKPRDKNGLVCAVDLRKKTIEATGAYSFEGLDPFRHAFRLCTLSNYLNMSPGIEVSACVKITKGAGSSANGPDNKPVCADGPISCESRGKPRPLRALGKANRARNEAQSDDISQDSPSGDSRMDYTRKVQRLLMDAKMSMHELKV